MEEMLEHGRAETNGRLKERTELVRIEDEMLQEWEKERISRELPTQDSIIGVFSTV